MNDLEFLDEMDKIASSGEPFTYGQLSRLRRIAYGIADPLYMPDDWIVEGMTIANRVRVVKDARNYLVNKAKAWLTS